MNNIYAKNKAERMKNATGQQECSKEAGLLISR